MKLTCRSSIWDVREKAEDYFLLAFLVVIHHPTLLKCLFINKNKKY